MSFAAQDPSREGGALRLPAALVDVVLGLLFLAGAVWYTLGAQDFPKPRSASHVGAGAFPTLIGIALVACSLAIVATALVRIRRRDARTRDIRRPLAVLGAVVGFVAFAELFDRIGALAALALLSLSIQLLVGERRWLHLLALPLGLALAIHVSFSVLLRVSLP